MLRRFWFIHLLLKFLLKIYYEPGNKGESRIKRINLFPRIYILYNFYPVKKVAFWYDAKDC